MDGISATAVIAAEPSPSRVCVLTTYGVDEYVYDALAAGASGFLLKTDTPERIIATVRSIAAGEFALGTETTAQSHLPIPASPDRRSGLTLSTWTV